MLTWPHWLRHTWICLWVRGNCVVLMVRTAYNGYWNFDWYYLSHTTDLQFFSALKTMRIMWKIKRRNVWFYCWLIFDSVLLPACGIWLKLSVFMRGSSIYGAEAIRSFKFSYNLWFVILEGFNIWYVVSVCNYFTRLAWLIKYD